MGKELRLIKITRNTRLWKKGQKVWVVFGTGALAALCLGRWQGKGRWIRGWAHWADKDGRGFFTRPDARWVGKVEVSEDFYYNVYMRYKCRPSNCCCSEYKRYHRYAIRY
jgi:hypothetical protein